MVKTIASRAAGRFFSDEMRYQVTIADGITSAPYDVHDGGGTNGTAPLARAVPVSVRQNARKAPVHASRMKRAFSNRRVAPRVT